MGIFTSPRRVTRDGFARGVGCLVGAGERPGGRPCARRTIRLRDVTYLVDDHDEALAFFVETDDFAQQHARMLRHGVRFREEPRHEPYGTVAVFEDLYGGAWDLIEPPAG